MTLRKKRPVNLNSTFHVNNQHSNILTKTKIRQIFIPEYTKRKTKKTWLQVHVLREARRTDMERYFDYCTKTVLEMFDDSCWWNVWWMTHWTHPASPKYLKLWIQDKDYIFTKKYPHLSYGLVAYTSGYEHTPSRGSLCKIILAHGLVEC